MGLKEDREAKKQERLEKAQEKRKPKLTYVHGIDGRRYINDKILRNLEGSQGGKTFSTYSSVANYESTGYLSYDDMMEETQKLTEEAADAQNPFDQFAQPSQQDGVSISHAHAAEIANADLEAAFQQAASVGRTVHATMNDMSLGAFQAQAFNNAPPETQVHGFNEAQATPEVHAEKVTGDINTTVYDGYYDAAQKAPFAFQPAMSNDAFNAAYAQQAADLPMESQNIFQDPNVPQEPAFPDHSGQSAPVQGQDQNYEHASGYVAPGAVGKPKGISAQPSKYGMLADDGDFEQSRPTPQQPPETSRTSQDARMAGMTVSQQMRALPPPVPYEQNQSQSSAPAQGKAEYNKLLGGLFKDGGAETPAESAATESPSQSPTSNQMPSFNQALKQAQSQSGQTSQPQQDAVAQSPWSGPQEAYVEPQPEPVQQPVQQEYTPQAEHQNEDQLHQSSDMQSRQNEPQQSEVASPSNDSLVDFPTTAEKEKPKFDRKKPPLPKQNADEVYFEDNATSGKTSIFKMPSEGVVRSSRGTVELLVHKGGRMFRPHYNPVGILLRVDVSDGFALIKGPSDKAPWQMTDREGNPLDEDVISTVAFDKKGNLWYETVAGKKTKFLVDGGVEVTTPGGETTKM